MCRSLGSALRPWGDEIHERRWRVWAGIQQVLFRTRFQSAILGNSKQEVSDA